MLKLCTKFLLTFILILISFTDFAQNDNPLLVEITKKNFIQGDTINFQVSLNDTIKILKAATLHLWIEQINSGRKWHYRYPFINRQMEGNLLVDTSITNGMYAFNFLLQNDFFSLKGKITNASKKDTAAKFFLVTKSKKLYGDEAPLDFEKSFLIRKLLFEDTAVMIFSNTRNKDKFLIQFETPLDSIFKPSSKVTQLIPINFTKDTSTIFSKEAKGYSFSFDSSFFQNMLPVAIVKSKAKKQIDSFEKDYVSGLFRGFDAVVFDGLESDEIANSIDIFSFLSGRVGGLRVKYDDGGIEYFSWRNQTADMYIDEIKTDPEAIRGISTTDIAMIKVFRPGSQVSFNSSAGGTICIYTKRGSYRKPNKISNFISIFGYNALDNYWK